MAYLTEIKEKMLECPDFIVSLLEAFDFSRVIPRTNEIRFARDESAGNNIRIRLKDNENINVMDYPRGICTDIFSYIVKEKNVSFRDVLQETKKILGLDDHWRPQQRRKLFGGIYEGLCRGSSQELKTYDESVLNDYIPCGNLLWLREGITLEAMRFYNVSFSPVDNAIIFPWRSPMGEIISLKARVNEKVVPEGMSKYYYVYSNAISNSLFNYSESYEHLYGADVCYCVESEKTCMKMWGWGIKNCVAIGSHSLSQEQIKLLLQLQCKEICLLLDKDLPLIETKKNADAIKQYARFRDIKISYWNWTYNLDLEDKSAPVDGTYDQFKYILKEEIEPIEKLDKEYEEI